MKNKKLFFLIIILALVFFYQKKSDKTASDVLLMNIEALALFENVGKAHCMFAGSLDCPIYEVKVYTIIRD